MKNILGKICEDKKIFIEKEKKKININFLIKNTSKKTKVRDFKKAFDKVLKKRKIPVISELKKKLDGVSTISLDTEFDWRTTYFPKLSIIQLGFSKKIFIFDCLSFNPSEFLKGYMEENTYLKIFHSVRSDTTVLFSSLSISMTNVFDIQAAQQIIEGGEIKNYAAIVKSYLPISLKKTETNSNWLKRPFTNEQLDYAAKDVEFLVRIYRKQKKILLLDNLWED